MPTELQGAMGDRLRDAGQEYGASTGRPRRCGWYDAVVVRYSARINGLDGLALTKLDVLDGLPEVQLCTAYRCGNEILTEFPADVRRLARCEPVYETLPGWSSPTHGVRSFDELPAEARAYVARLEEISGVPATVVSTGSDRNETVFREGTIISRWLETKGR